MCANTLPVGEDAWLALIEEQSRLKSKDLNGRIEVMELYKQAANSLPGSLRIWIAYCEFFWSLYSECQPHANNYAGWSHEERAMGSEVFTLDAALSIWQKGYEAIRYRLSDSHELWNRWIALEMDLLARTGTSEGVRRITHLFRHRLQTPHRTWDKTSQMFSSFLSEYNKAAWESSMQEITGLAQNARQLWDERDTFEMRLSTAAKAGNVDEEKAAMTDYLDWEMRQNRKIPKLRDLLVEICLGLYARALTGIFARDEGVWTDYVVWVSSLHSIYNSSQSRTPEMAQILPNNLDVLQRAVQHCPWSGNLWARYILCAEEAGLSFHDVERIKHAATASSQLDKDDMSGVIDMYAAWCGFLKRRAMNPNATDEDADVADIGLVAALEDVQVWGSRKYGDDYKGDPNFRLERILIQYLTEKNPTVDEARNYWNELAKRELYADSYNFWLSYYMWEMSAFAAQKGKSGRSPTPNTLANKTFRIPSLATNVLSRAVNRRTLDWPEKVMEIYLQHCNDYEPPDAVRRASDTVHKGRKAVAKRREKEQADAAAAYGAQYSQYQQQLQAQATEGAPDQAATEADETSSAKRKRLDDSRETEANSSKRMRQDAEDPPSDTTKAEQQRLKRDRENTSAFVLKLPPDVTQTKVRQYFREYGHIRSLTLKPEKGEQSAICLIEFETHDEVQSALLRDGKYFGQHQIKVTSATGTTLFVTNYPPQADEAYIRTLFKECGEIFSIRWPSLKFNTHRRFCYVTFRDPASAARATELDGKMLETKYKLEAKYSNPAHKKARDGAIEEGRELHVTNVDGKVSETDIQKTFEKYGSVERVRILTNKFGESRGTAFVVFERKEDAERAMKELDKTKFRSSILKVEKSTPTNFKPVSTTGPSMSPSPSVRDEEEDAAMQDRDDAEFQRKSDDNKARTFALIGLPDTVNDARVRALVEPHGRLIRVTLRPDHGGAILEFEDAVTAGKAQMALEGVEIDGRKLRTGSVAALFKEKGETRLDRVDVKPVAATKPAKSTNVAMMAPPSMTVRRPALGGKSGGMKRGLGFVGAINKQNKDAKDKSSTTTGTEASTGTGGKKSNADFRAMLLDIGRVAEERGQTEVDHDGKKAEEAVVSNGDGC